MGYAFISYSSTQQRQLNQVKEYLTANGISFWNAPDDIPIGSKYSEVITRAIANASCVLFLLSDRSQNSTYCKLEIALALKMEKPVIPIQLEDVILNDDFSLYLSRSEIFPIPKKISTAKTNKLLHQLKLLCAEPGQAPVAPVDPSYRIGKLKKGTWMQLFGWIWIVGGFIPFCKFADLCYPVPPRLPGFGGDGYDEYNAPVIADLSFNRGVLITALVLLGLMVVCYGFTLNRKLRGTERLYFKQFSLCQVLLLISYAFCGISFPLAMASIADHLDHYVSTFLVETSSYIFYLSILSFLVTFLIWLFQRIRRKFKPN